MYDGMYDTLVLGAFGSGNSKYKLFQAIKFEWRDSYEKTIGNMFIINCYS